MTKEWPTPKGAGGLMMRAQPLHGSTGTHMPLKDQAQGKGQAVGHNNSWSITFISYNLVCAFPRPSLCAEPCCAGKAEQSDLTNKDSLILLGNKTEKLLIQSEQKAD